MRSETKISAWRKRRKRLPAVAIGTVTALLAALEFAVINPAQAIPAKPWTDWGYYMSSSSTSTAYSLGCNQGNTDRDEGDINSEEYIDFGVQIAGYQNEMIDGDNISDASIEADAEQFANGYYSCTGSDASSTLTLGIGTNNDGNGGSAYGETWAQIVNAVSSWVIDNAGQVTVIGADDIEPNYQAPATTMAWESGFAANTTAEYLNIGSADGCPESSSNNGSCNNGWDQYDVWYLAYGAAPATVAPEIYVSGQGLEWAELCEYGVQSQGGPILFQGPLDDNAFDSSYYTSSQAWSDLLNDLNAFSSCVQTPPYSLEAHNE
jgi:hypothetical protein